MQQVVRELPSLTMGAQMFFIAISNNLPMLADQIKKARTEYAALIAQGQKATPVWKQILGSIVSWQTALVMGITLLTLHGKEIGAWVSSLFKGSKALDDAAGRQKTFNKEVYESYKGMGESIVAVKKLSTAWKVLGGDMQAQKQFIADNKGEFDKLDVSVHNAAEAENLLIRNTPAFIESLKLKAQAAAAQKLAAQAYEEQLAKEKEANDREEKGTPRANLPSWMNALASYGISATGRYEGVSDDEKAERAALAEQRHQKEIERLREEAEAARKNGDAYFDLSQAKKTESAATLASAGIRDKEKGDSEKAAVRLKAEMDERLGEIEAMRKKIQSAALEAELELREEELRLTDEGLEKTLAEIDLAYDKRMAEIAKKGEELVKAQREVERKAWEAAHPDWKDEGLSPPEGTTSVEQLPEAARRNLDDRVFLAQQQRLKDIVKAEEGAARQIEGIWEEVNRKSLSDLDNELKEIDAFYKEKIKKAREAGAKEQEIARLLAAKEKETEEAKSEAAAKSALKRIDTEEDIAQKLLDAKEKGDIFYLVKKNNLEKKYAAMRLAVLKKAYATASGEQAKQIQVEITAMENSIRAYEEIGETLKKDIASNLLSSFSEVTSAIGEMNEALGETVKRTEAMISAAQQLISRNYIGAAVTVISSALSNLARENAEAVAAAKKSEADYWDAVNYKIERQIELMKELKGITEGQVAASIQEQIDALTNTITTYDFSYSLTQFERYGDDIMRGFGTATDDFTRNLLNLMGFDDMSGFGANKRFLFYDKLSGLTTEELISLLGIEEIWRVLPTELQEYIGMLSDAVDKQKELAEYTDELHTATTRNAIADTIIEGFAEGKRSAQDYADDFEQMMKDAILRSIRINALQQPLEEWYKTFSDYASDGLTEEEIIELRRIYNEIVGNASKRLSDMEEVTGIDMQEAARRASQKGLEAMNQDSADALNGKFTTMLYYQDKMCVSLTDMQTLVASAVSLMGEIALNTSYCRHLEAVDRNIEKMTKDMGTIIRDGLPVKK